MKRLFQAAFGIRPDELSLVQGFFALFAAIGVASTIGLTAADTLFLSRFQPAEAEKLLPVIYVGIGFVGVSVSALYDRVAASAARLPLVVGTLAALGGSLLLFRQALLTGARPLFFGLVIWIEICGLLSTTLVFAHAGDTFSGRDAKRLYGYITGGLAVGTIISGWAVDPLVQRLGAEGLLYAAGGAFLVAAAVAGWTFRLRGARRGSAGEEDEAGGVPLSAMLSNRHVLLTFAFGLGGLLCSVLGDYQLKIVASRSMDEAQLAAFFGAFWAYLGVAQLLVQFILVGWLLRRFGLLGGLLVMPLMVLGGSAGFVMWPVVLAAAGSEFARLCFADTMEGPSRELLFLPLPARLRTRAQAFAGGALDAGGQAVAGLLVFGAMLVLPHIRWLGVVTFVVAALWLLAARAIRPHYERTLAASLRDARLGAADLAPLLGSAEATKVLRDMLREGGARAELALELLEARGRAPERVDGVLDPPLAGLVDDVARLAREARPSVAALAVARLGESDLPEVVPHLELAAEDPRPPVRAAALLALARHLGAEGADRLEAHLGEHDPQVLEAALVASLRYGGERAERPALARIAQLARDVDPAARRLAARVIGTASRVDGGAASASASASPATTPVLAELLGDADPAVAGEALRAARSAADPELLPLLCEPLSRVATRRQAVAAISALPRRAVAAIGERALDRTRPEAERIALPRALATIGGDEAASVLFRMTRRDEPLLVRLEAARALRSLEGAPAAIAPAALDERIDELLATLELLERAAGECAGGRPLRSRLFADHARLHLSLLMALVAVRHGGGDRLARAEANLFSPDPLLSSNALELVDAVLPRPLSARVAPRLLALTSSPASPGPDLSDRTRAALLLTRNAWLTALAAREEEGA